MSRGRHAAQRNWTRIAAAAAGSALAISTTAVTIGVGGAEAAAAGPAAVDLADPSKDVRDPAGNLAEVNTECSPGQVDLNLASSAELGMRLEVPSDPTVNRIIALRPWLKGADLSSVPGIGPDRAAALAGRTCATQSTLPPAVKLACPDTKRVDLQIAPAPTIASRLKLPLETAAALVAARPLPQDLRQVIAPRVPGLSEPKLNELLRAKTICVTPAPMLAGSGAWRWATPAGGVSVSRDDFSLIVPPGRVTQPAGAYASVVPLPLDDDGLPRMDATIHGAWTTGTHPVAVRGPWLGGDTERPVVFHAAADRGATASLGTSVATGLAAGRPVATSLAYSLSEFSYGSTECQAPQSFGGTPVLCLADLTDGSLRNAWLTEVEKRAASVKPPDWATCGDFNTGVSIAKTQDDLPEGIACSVAAAPAGNLAGTAAWKLKSTASTQWFGGLVEFGTVFRTRVTDGYSTHQTTGEASSNPIIAKVAQLMNTDIQLFPGETLGITKRPSFKDTDVMLTTDSDATIEWVAIGGLAGDLVEMAGPSAVAIYQQLTAGQNCGAGDVACIKQLLDSAIAIAHSQLQATLLTDEARKQSKAYRILSGLKKVFKVVTIGEVVGSVARTIYVYGTGTGATLTNHPNKPQTDSAGRVVFDGCLSKNDVDWIINSQCQNARHADVGGVRPGSGGGTSGLPQGKIARDVQGHAWFVNQATNQMQPIATGGAYLCLARHYIVDWEADLADYMKTYAVLTAPATCDGDLAETRTLLPGQLPQSSVLRQADGTAYFVDGTRRWHIETGGAFHCWVDPDFNTVIEFDVWDQVPQAVIDAYPDGDHGISNCGDPENPTF